MPTESYTLRSQNFLDESLLWSGLAKMVTCGESFFESISALRRAFPAYDAELNAINEETAQRRTVSDALKRFPNSFHPIIYSLIKDSEGEGRLPLFLQEGAEVMKRRVSDGVYSRTSVPDDRLFKIAFLDYSSMIMLDTDTSIRGFYENPGIGGIIRRFSDNPSIGEMQGALRKMGDEIEHGALLSEAMAGNPYFTRLDYEMMHIGEESGIPEVMLKKLADYASKSHLIEVLRIQDHSGPKRAT